MSQRISGYDVARALAIFGMVAVNYKIAMGAHQTGPARGARPTVESVATGSAAVFCAAAVVFAHLWRRRFRRGPLEWVMRRITNF